ncbi:hypothetical protein EE612_028671, partial [Oryza sativa]
RSPPHLRGSGSGGCRRTSTRRGRRCATRSRSTSTPLRRRKRSPRARRRGDDIRLGGGVRVERGQHHASAAGLDAAGRRRRRQGPRGVGVDLHDGDDAASATVLRLGRGVRVGEPERWWRRQAGCSCLRQAGALQCGQRAGSVPVPSAKRRWWTCMPNVVMCPMLARCLMGLLAQTQYAHQAWLLAIIERGGARRGRPEQQETLRVLSVFRELNPNEMLARNTPKLEVERKEGGNTRVEIYCAGKLGLLLSTVSTLETLG